jgi:hypothetical protein
MDVMPSRLAMVLRTDHSQIVVHPFDAGRRLPFLRQTRDVSRLKRTRVRAKGLQ